MKFQINEDCQIKDLGDIYEKYLPDIGFFVEVGAYDGITHSNTLGLIKAGWSGIMIEPVKSHFAQLKENMKNYPKIECLNVAISNETGNRMISVRGEWSTINTKFNKVINSLGFAPEIEGVEMAKVVPLHMIMDNYYNVDLLIIDTEGSELEVLESMRYSKLPGMIIIELHEHSDLWNKHYIVRETTRKIKERLEKRYDIVYSDDINTIFVKKQK